MTTFRSDRSDPGEWHPITEDNIHLLMQALNEHAPTGKKFRLDGASTSPEIIVVDDANDSDSLR